MRNYLLRRYNSHYRINDIIHLWKIQQEIIPNDLNLTFYNTARKGWKCRRNIIQNRKIALQTIRYNSFTYRAAALFNSIPKNVKDSPVSFQKYN